MSLEKTRASRARRGFGVERQRAHREARMAPPLSEAEAAHLALVEATAEGQRIQAESEAAGVAEGVREAATDGTVSPSSATPALPTASDAQQGRAEGKRNGQERDPRLGTYLTLGVFLTHCFKRLGYQREHVMAVAGLTRTHPTAALLDYPGGLARLYAACEAEKKARAA